MEQGIVGLYIEYNDMLTLAEPPASTFLRLASAKNVTI